MSSPVLKCVGDGMAIHRVILWHSEDVCINVTETQMAMPCPPHPLYCPICGSHGVAVDYPEDALRP